VIRLVATDLDGTLLDSDSRVPPANREALARVLAHGVRLVLATARKASSTQTIAALLDLPCAQVVHNGARTWDWSGAELRHFRVPYELALAIARYADQRNVGLITTVDEINYYVGEAQSLRRSDDVVVRSNVEALVGPPTRMIAVGAEAINLLCDEFGAVGDAVVIHRYYSRVGALESAVFTHPQATKEQALIQLCAAHGITARDVLALGDAEADAAMLRWAGVGVAMANAMEDARRAADWIAPSHDEAGVAAAIERFVFDASAHH
jgi:5-amino-6-(5-phospho-D-ribitylamino)uracil phosphatase